MRRIIPYSAAAAVACALYAPLAAGEKAKDVKTPEQNHCFCVQYTGQGLSPYYLGKLKPGLPGCDKLKYDPGPEPGPPWENGLLSCDALKKCLAAGKDHEDKRAILTGKLAEADKSAAACCKAEGCDAKCSSDWSAIKNILTKELQKQDKVAARTEKICFPDKKTVKEPGPEKKDGEQAH